MTKVTVAEGKLREPDRFLGRSSRWSMLTIVAFLVGAGYFAVQGVLATGAWWRLIFLIGFVCLVGVLVLGDLFINPIHSIAAKSHRWRQVMLGALMALSATMSLLIHPHLAMLFVVVCLLAIELLRKRTAMIWVGICIVVVFCTELIHGANRINLQDALMNSLLTLFISGFAFLKIEAEKAQQQTHKLLLELEVKNQQLAEFSAERELKSRMEERQQLSRELHDTLGHKLTTSIVQLEAAHKFIEKDSRRVATILTTVRSLLRDGLDETRNIVHLLDRHIMTKQSLAETLARLGQDFQSATGLIISLNVNCDESKISAQYKRHLMRIVQEALTNVSRHAQARHVNITVAVESRITLVIEDDGVALNEFNDVSLPSVKSIDSRVAELNGSLLFLREGSMTKLKISIPIDSAGVSCVH